MRGKILFIFCAAVLLCPICYQGSVNAFNDTFLQSIATQYPRENIQFNENLFVLKSIMIVVSIIFAAALLVWVVKGCPKTLSLRTILFGVSLVFAGMIIAICSFVLILLQWEKKLSDIEVRKYESLRLAYELKQSSDDLTRFARTFASTGEFNLRPIIRISLPFGRHQAPPG